MQARQSNANHSKASKAMHAKQSTTMQSNANQSKASNANSQLGSHWDNLIAFPVLSFLALRLFPLPFLSVLCFSFTACRFRSLSLLFSVRFLCSLALSLSWFLSFLLYFLALRFLCPCIIGSLARGWRKLGTSLAQARFKASIRSPS